MKDSKLNKRGGLDFLLLPYGEVSFEAVNQCCVDARCWLGTRQLQSCFILKTWRGVNWPQHKLRDILRQAALTDMYHMFIYATLVCITSNQKWLLTVSLTHASFMSSCFLHNFLCHLLSLFDSQLAIYNH